MDKIFESIEEWMRNLLIGMVSSNLTNMFTDVNEKTGDIASQVGQTPQGWNGSIFSLIQNLSDSVIVPIAGMIITFVLCYELISMLTEKNNMHDIDTWMFFKYFLRGFANIKEFEIEYYQRIAMSFAAFILTTIGVSLSSRKVKGGMGLNLGVGLALSFSYILFQTVSATFAINGNTPPIVAVWIPNILYTLIAIYLYRKAPK